MTNCICSNWPCCPCEKLPDCPNASIADTAGAELLINEDYARLCSSDWLKAVSDSAPATPAPSSDTAGVKPVAWMNAEGWFFTDDPIAVKHHEGLIPLYAAPPAPSVADATCAHDYVRSDNVCIECGNKSSVADAAGASERERFERAAIKINLNIHRQPADEKYADYLSLMTEKAWLVWKEARAKESTND